MLLPALLMFQIISAQAQVSAQVSTGNGLTQGYYTFGLNAGWSYQSSDVQIGKGGYGFGATLGRNLFYRQGAPVSFDIRGRFLYARQYGFDPFRSYSIEKNTALNGSRPGGLDYLNYPASLGESRGFAFLNHRTDVGELALEGVFTLNRLRENTGIILSLYGGIGADWYRAKLDQADANGNAYYADYAALKDGQPTDKVKATLREDVLDGQYETLADGYNNNAGQIGLMPSVGFELGYQFTPRFSMSLGHRMTFAGTDVLDGHRWEDNRNDKYHYTSFGLNWAIQPRKSKPLAPVIEIISPASNPFTTRDAGAGRVRANIRHVNNPMEVSCDVNGRPLRFDFSDGRFGIDFPLKPGRNEVVVGARNEAGSDTETVIIYWEEPDMPNPPQGGQRPNVRFSSPSSPDYRVNNPDFKVRAIVTEVNNASNIEFTVNGSERNFNFDARSGELTADINLREGDNSIRIYARNSRGTDEAATNVIYERRDNRPQVQITDPDREEVQVSERRARIRATVRNVNTREEITMRVNGRELRSFTFEAARETLQADLDLDAGSNRVEIIAQNRAGSSTDEVTIIYRPADTRKPPVVRITLPDQANTTTTKSTANIEATIENVSNRADVSLLLNGRNINAFNFNTGNGRLSATLDLVIGSNEVQVRARNRDGDAEDGVVIRRIEGDVNLPQPPRITITQPAEGSVSSQKNTEVKAQITKVNSRDDITFTVNGKRLVGFEFSPSNGNFKANISLETGNNTIRIQARNNDGADDKTVNVRYQAAQPPTVQITQPANNATVNESAQTLKASTQYVGSKNDISVYHNGKQLFNFDFNTSRQELSATVYLEEGNNTLRVRVQNADGSNEATVNVKYQKLQAPSVNIQQPADNAVTDKSTADFKALTQNVGSKNEVKLWLNEQPVGNFNYNNQQVTATLNLQAGNNSVRIRVENAGGSNEDKVSFRYEPPKGPVVTITDPASDLTTQANNYTVKARVQNVKDRSEISVWVNGQTNTQFTYNNGEVTINATLRDGENTVRIKAQNRGGTDEKTARITKKQPQPPVVTIQTPVNGTKVTTPEVPVKATITNVKGKDAIRFAVDGKLSDDFVFDKGQLTANVKGLKPGKHSIRIQASNADGEHEASTAFTIEPKAEEDGPGKPEVTIVQPAKPGTTAKENPTTIVATVSGVAGKSDIQVLANKKQVEDFTYDAKKQELRATVTLQKGTNTIVVRAINEAGEAQASTTINFNPATGGGNQQKPVIEVTSVSQPVTNPFYPNVGNSTVLATIEHVTNKDQITFTVNGQAVTNFSFNVKTKQFEGIAPLNRGDNTIVIKAKNEAGEDVEERQVTF